VVRFSSLLPKDFLALPFFLPLSKLCLSFPSFTIFRQRPDRVRFFLGISPLSLEHIPPSYTQITRSTRRSLSVTPFSFSPPSIVFTTADTPKNYSYDFSFPLSPRCSLENDHPPNRAPVCILHNASLFISTLSYGRSSPCSVAFVLTSNGAPPPPHFHSTDGTGDTGPQNRYFQICFSFFKLRQRGAVLAEDISAPW